MSPAPSLDSVPTHSFSTLEKSFPTKYLASVLHLATAVALVWRLVRPSPGTHLLKHIHLLLVYFKILVTMVIFLHSFNNGDPAFPLKSSVSYFLSTEKIKYFLPSSLNTEWLASLFLDSYCYHPRPGAPFVSGLSCYIWMSSYPCVPPLLPRANQKTKRQADSWPEVHHVVWRERASFREAGGIVCMPWLCHLTTTYISFLLLHHFSPWAALSSPSSVSGNKWRCLLGLFSHLSLRIVGRRNLLPAIDLMACFSMPIGSKNLSLPFRDHPIS